MWRDAQCRDAAVAALAPLGGDTSFLYRLKNYGADSSIG
jgi:hypothetical protein